MPRSSATTPSWAAQATATRALPAAPPGDHQLRHHLVQRAALAALADRAADVLTTEALLRLPVVP
jgi:hypothetical protein